MPESRIYIALGTNIGDRLHNLRTAVQALSLRYDHLVQSPVYETEPQEVTDQPHFLNMVVGAESRFAPTADVAYLLELEKELGRNRTDAIPKGPRLIDLDLLLHGDSVFASKDLTVPHPRMQNRKFVLVPLIAIAPELIDPRNGHPFSRYLALLPPQGIYFAHSAAYNDKPPYGGSSSRE